MTEFPLINATIFAGLGILVFIVAVSILSRLSPFDPWKQIVQEKNVAAAILAGAVALALGWIVAAAMH
jgi:putative membrane protein